MPAEMPGTASGEGERTGGGQRREDDAGGDRNAHGCDVEAVRPGCHDRAELGAVLDQILDLMDEPLTSDNRQAKRGKIEKRTTEGAGRSQHRDDAGVRASRGGGRLRLHAQCYCYWS